MTIEIKQLIIRAVVEEVPRPAASPAGRPAPPPTPSVAPRDPPIDRDALIAECTRHVLRELRKERGR